MYVCMNVFMYVCMYVCMYLCTYINPFKVLAVFYGTLRFINVFIKPQNTNYAEPNNCCSHSHILLHQKILHILVTHKPCLPIFLFSGFKIKFSEISHFQNACYISNQLHWTVKVRRSTFHSVDSLQLLLCSAVPLCIPL